ncbi:hypothetical protein GCM10020331_057830 [Ectobacillus funiculus]
MQNTIAKITLVSFDSSRFFITYSLAYLDRANYGFGAAAGLAKDLHITASMSSLLGSLFFS